MDAVERFVAAYGVGPLTDALRSLRNNGAGGGGDEIAGCALVYGDPTPGKVGWIGGFNIASIAAGTPAPGKTSWVVTLSSPPSSGIFLPQVSVLGKDGTPFFVPRVHFDDVSQIEVFLIDATGAVVDASLAADGAIFLSILRAGTSSGEAP